MDITYKVGVLVGSLRKGSYSRMLANTLIDIAPKNLEGQIIEIGDLPLYNEDLDKDPPQQWTEIRDQVRGMDANLFVTPEYNRSVPGALKNAIDVGSRPYGKSVWDKKPAGVISGSISGLSGFGANHALRQSLVFLNMPVMQQPEGYIANFDKLFGDDDKITNAGTKEFLTKFMATFGEWISRVAAK